VALIAGEREFADGVWQVKDLRAQSQQTVGERELVAAVRKTVEG
jgi:histidyl-tRNA synthetase